MIIQYKNWKYKNTGLLLVSLFLFFYFADSALVQGGIRYLGELGYLGAFITGIFFVSVFTVAPASVVLFFLAENLSPVTVAILAGLGAVLGDYLIYRFIKDQVFEELKPAFNKYGGSYISKLLHTPYFAWLMPVIGAAIIASPFPDEVGLGLMGLGQVKTWQFLVVTFVLNAIGIFIVVTLAAA